jgi:hypothetical protein
MYVCVCVCVCARALTLTHTPNSQPLLLCFCTLVFLPLSAGWIRVLGVLLLPGKAVLLVSLQGTQQGWASCPVNFPWLWALESCTLSLSRVCTLGWAPHCRSRLVWKRTGWRIESLPQKVAERLQQPSAGRAQALFFPTLPMPARYTRMDFVLRKGPVQRPRSRYSCTEPLQDANTEAHRVRNTQILFSSLTQSHVQTPQATLNPSPRLSHKCSHD